MFSLAGASGWCFPSLARRPCVVLLASDLKWDGFSSMLMHWLQRWWKAKPMQDVRVVMFTREGCHLCEDAWELLEKEQQRAGFLLSSIDIANNPELESKYGTEIPVVQINGQVRFRGRVNVVLLRRLLRALQDKSQS